MAALVLALSVAALAFLIYAVIRIDVQMLRFGDLPFNHLSTALVDVKIQQSRQLFQLGLVVIGGLWAAVLISKETRLSAGMGAAELVMFGSASVVLVLAELSHLHYVGVIYEALLLGAATSSDGQTHLSIPNVFDSEIEIFYSIQLGLLFLGIGIGAVTLVCAHCRNQQPTESSGALLAGDSDS